MGVIPGNLLLAIQLQRVGYHSVLYFLHKQRGHEEIILCAPADVYQPVLSANNNSCLVEHFTYLCHRIDSLIRFYKSESFRSPPEKMRTAFFRISCGFCRSIL